MSSGKCLGIGDPVTCDLRLRGDPTDEQWAVQHAAGARKQSDLQKEPPRGIFTEPRDHGLGRSRGGFTTKLRLAVGQGQNVGRGDGRTARGLAGHVRPDRVRADKEYASRRNRAYLRRRGIRCTQCACGRSCGGAEVRSLFSGLEVRPPRRRDVRLHVRSNRPLVGLDSAHELRRGERLDLVLSWGRFHRHHRFDTEAMLRLRHRQYIGDRGRRPRGPAHHKRRGPSGKAHLRSG